MDEFKESKIINEFGGVEKGRKIRITETRFNFIHYIELYLLKNFSCMRPCVTNGKKKRKLI